MKKHLLLMLWAVIAATMGVYAQTIVIDDGFENGIQDSVWTQEFVVGNHPWVVESKDDNLAYPATVYQGSKRACLRNTSGETEGYVTRLVSKVMDLSPEKVYQPELTFWYANPKWTADRDTLRVLYRTSQNAKWKKLAEFSSAASNWQKIRLELPEVNESYQVAFEGTDNLGRGIVLDSVKLRSAPICTVPHDISINSLGAGKVKVAWNASWDAVNYEMIITKEIIGPDTINLIPDSLGIVVYHDLIDGLKQNVEVNLVSGEHYYIYLRSICEAENSLWNSEDPEQQGAYYFRVKATKNVPYSYGFDMPYEAGILRRDLEWTWGGNTGSYNPFVNVGLKLDDRGKYSPNATSCVVFSSGNVLEPKATNAIPANKYAYVATPALADTANAQFALNQCRVRFWGSVAEFSGDNYAHSIIVGVMEDAEDITTFVPVDTVSIWAANTFQENVVDLGSYKGNGVYVAFLSAFNEPNIFFLDEISIEYKDDLQKPTALYVNPRDTWAKISWKGTSSSYNVMITNEEVDPAKATPAQIVAQTTVTTNSYLCEALEADHSWNRPYYVYVQAVSGAQTSDWSYRYPFVTISGKKEVPYSIDFEQKNGTTYTIGESAIAYPVGVGVFSNIDELPHLVTSNAHASSSCLTLSLTNGNDAWITLPQIDSLAGMEVKFYLSGSSTPTQAHATLGIMTNPLDINTFIPVSDYKVASTGYTLCYANFANYNGPEGIIAIVWSDVNGKNTINYIDDVTVQEMSKCLPPVNIIMDATSDSVTISWDKSIATAWEFILATKQLTEKQLQDSFEIIAANENILFADTLSWEDAQTNPTFGFDSLDYNTPYYIYVRTLCGEEVTWWVQSSFKTPCPTDFPIPFSENFESYSTGAYEDGFACWQVADYGTGTGYPKILKPSSGAQDGNMLELWSTSTTHRNVAMLPGLAVDYSQVVLSFDARSYGTATKSVVYVGSMGDINDWTSFVAIDTIYMDGGNTFTQVRLDLSNYTLAYNNIAFTSGLGENLEMNSDIYIDNVSIKPNNCIEAWNFEATDIQVNSISIKWDGKATNDQWIVKVMQDTNFIALDTVIGKAYQATGLEPVKLYTFYVQPSCDTIWSTASFRTGCVKLDPNKPNKETFENYPSGTSYNVDYQAPCWTVGNGNPSAATTYIPYIYKTTSYASSGTNCYRLNPTAANSPTWVAAPEIDCNSLTELAVTFSYYGSSSYYILPGVMTDPEDLSTFVVLDSIKCAGSIVTMTMDLSEYADTIPAGAKYFAWRTAYNAAPTIYLDDVSIIKLNCPLPKPSYSGLTSEQVRISAGIRGDNEWLLLVSDTAAFTADQLALINVDSLAKDSAAASHIIYYDTIDVRNKVVTGLKEQTDYYVAVATLCEDGISQWSEFSFKTPCKAVTPEALGTITFSKNDGYVSGSSATRYLPCWTVGNKSGNASLTTSYIPYVYTSSTYLHNKDSVLCVYSYSPTSSTSTKYNGAYAIMPELDVQDISKYQVNFYARAYSTASYGDQLIVGVVTDPSDLNTFVVIDTVTLSHTAYAPYSISLEDYQGDYQQNMGRYIMFTNECSGSVIYNYSFIASISVTPIPTCRPVTEFKVDSVSDRAGMISWKQYSNSYRMMLADKIVADTAKANYQWLVDSIVTKTDSVLITGLEPAQQYYVYAQAMCDGGDSSDISMAYAFFTTLCPEDGFKVPYKQNFEAYATNAKVVDCWQFEDYATATKTYPQVMNPTSGAVDGKQLELWSSSTSHRSVAIMPKVQGNLSDYMLSFDARSYSTTGKSVLYIGTMDDVLDSAAGFAPFDTLYMDNGNVFFHKDLILADYNLVHSRIAFSSGLAEELEMASDMYLDNVRLGMPPSCFAPTLEAGNSSMYSAEIVITPAKEENKKWQLAYVVDSIYTADKFDAEAYLDTTNMIFDADSVVYEIKGLEPGTVYQVYARTVCGGEDGNSEWTSKPTKVRTQYYFKDKYYFGFEKDEGWEFCQGSSSTTYWINPAIGIGYEGGSATTSYTSYYPYQMANTSSAIYAYGPKDNPKNGVLRWQATSTYWGGYAIFPAVDEAHDRSFEFKVRSGYGSYNSTKDTIGISTNYACNVEVGTIDKNKGFETYQVLTTIYLPVIPKVKGGLTEANDWFWTQISLDLDSATVANKQMVIRLPKPSDSSTRYIHFDDVTLGAPKGYGLVSIKNVQAEAKKATVNWSEMGGPWNLYILKENGDTLAKYENLTATSQEVTGLQPQTGYTAVLIAINAPSDTKFKVSDSREFRTPCLPMEANANGEFFWDFDDPTEVVQNDLLAGAAADTAYLKPECFTTGTTYTGSFSNGYQWLWQSKGHDYYSTLGNPSDTYNHREIGYADSYGSLRVYTTSTYVSETVKTYIVLPQLNCDLDTMMIEFWGRCLANQDETAASNAGKIISTLYLGASYCQSLVVGTLTDPNDFSTLQVIDTVTYTYTTSQLTTSTLVSSDPTGNRYWQKMQLPLAGATGKYIVLFQPAYGLFFVDNLKIKAVGDNLFAPSGASTSDVTYNSATFNWTVKHPNIQSVVVLTNQGGDSIILQDTVPGSVTTYTVNTLKPSTGYQWYMYQTNGTINTSTTAYQPFYTECVAVGPDYKNGFELADGWRILPAQTSDTYKQTLCWTYENAGTSAVSTYEYNYANGTSVYSHSGAYALRLYASGTTYQTYAAMPAIEDIAAYDTLQVNFWMRPAYASASTGKISTQYTLGSSAATKEYYYSKSVIVGTMTDPMDATTFVPIDTITYNGTLSTSDYVNEANDFLFQPKKVALTGAQGKYVAFMATLWAKGAENKSTYDYIWIDDVSFSAIQHCETPEELTADEIAATSAKLSWKAPEGAASYILQVSTDYTYANDSAFVFNDTVYSNSAVVDGLKAFTDYVWRVRTICEEDLGESEFSQNANFTTARQPFFVETFGATDLEVGWSFATNPALTVIDSTDVELTGANSTSYGWRRVTTDAGIPGAHYAAVFYSSSATATTDYDYYWMISPTISLEDSTKNAHLTFDMALTACSSTTTPSAAPATDANMADDFTFMIVISEDGGKTWKKENIIGIWNNTFPTGNQLRDIPFAPTSVRFDLAKYAGKNIKVAFYREADTYLSSPYPCAIHLDNIRVNYYDNIVENAQACQYEDIDKIGFHIDGDKSIAGDSIFKRIDMADNFDATTKGYLDSIYTLNVKIFEAPETVIYDTICAGDTYSDENFSGKSRTGVYRRKLQSVEHCDSIVTLNLFVAPIMETTEFDTICYGGVYKWHGKEFNRTGLYTDTLVSIYNCDSIVYLSLTVKDQIVGQEEKTICHGGSLVWNGKVYDKPGDYKDTLQSVSGCDSIVTLTLKMSDIIMGETQKEEICFGNTFTWNGKVYNQTGVYQDTLQALGGCDSLAVLELTVMEMKIGATIRETICHGGTYRWHGKDYDAAGTYQDTLISVQGCDSVVTLVLTIAPMIEGTPVEEAICHGGAYVWNGKRYTQPGTYKDTLLSGAGCDSIATLILYVSDMITGQPLKQSICAGDAYTWNGKVYDIPGEYKDTLQSVSGCDSIAILQLSVVSILPGEPEKATICQGDSYAWNGGNYTEPGMYRDTVPSTAGCDSIISLVLSWYNAEDTIYMRTTITTDDLPFTYENSTYPYAEGQAPISYPMGTEPGTYMDTVLVVGQHCDAVMIHALVVNALEGIEAINTNGVVLRPNVIRAGEQVTAVGNFTGMVDIYVHDMVGRLIKHEKVPAASAVTVSAFNQTGIYQVRISDSVGTQYVGRVLVW